MFGLIAKLTSGIARLFHRSRNSQHGYACLDDPIREQVIELERARAHFDDATHRVSLLRRHLDDVRAEGRLNRGQLALLQRDLQQAARNAQSAFDAATRAQDELAVLESVKAGHAKVQRAPAIPQAMLESLLRDVALADARAEQYRDVKLELDETVYGNRNTEAENLSILAVDSKEAEPVEAARAQHVGEVRRIEVQFQTAP